MQHEALCRGGGGWSSKQAAAPEPGSGGECSVAVPVEWSIVDRPAGPGEGHLGEGVSAASGE
jgi:hypothetical protein